MSKLKNLADGSKVNINTIIQDIEDFKFSKKFDVVIAIGLLSFFTENKAKDLLKKIKESTKKGGLNAIAVRTTDDKSKGIKYFFKKSELNRLYNDWEILIYSEHNTFKEHKDHKHKCSHAVILARKP